MTTPNPSSAGDFQLPTGLLAIIGDTREPDPFECLLDRPGQAASTLFASIAELRPHALLHLGDIALFGAKARFWRGWRCFDREAKPVQDAGIPIYPILGNHEYRGPGGRHLREYFRRFPHLGGLRWYSIRSGAWLFLCLDSNFAALGQTASAAQREWLATILRAAEADDSVTQVVPLIHHPPYTNVSPRYFVFESKSVQREFVPLVLGSAKTNLVLSGHVHSLEWLRVHERSFVVAGGGGSPRFRLRPRASARRKELLNWSIPLRPFHYLTLNTEVSKVGDSMSIQILDRTQAIKSMPVPHAD